MPRTYIEEKTASSRNSAVKTGCPILKDETRLVSITLHNQRPKHEIWNNRTVRRKDRWCPLWWRRRKGPPAYNPICSRTKINSWLRRLKNLLPWKERTMVAQRVGKNLCQLYIWQKTDSKIKNSKNKESKNQMIHPNTGPGAWVLRKRKLPKKHHKRCHHLWRLGKCKSIHSWVFIWLKSKRQTTPKQFTQNAAWEVRKLSRCFAFSHGN